MIVFRSAALLTDGLKAQCKFYRKVPITSGEEDYFDHSEAEEEKVCNQKRDISARNL